MRWNAIKNIKGDKEEDPQETAACAAFLAGSALPGAAAGWIEKISVRNGLTLNLNGETIVSTDAFGRQMPVFLYQNSTYVPVCYISEQVGKRQTGIQRV